MKRHQYLNILLLSQEPEYANTFKVLFKNSSLPVSNVWSRSLEEDLSVLKRDSIIHLMIVLVKNDQHKLDVFQKIHLFEGLFPIVIISKEYNDDFAAECIELGAEDFFLHQPIDSECLYRYLNNVIIRFKRTACLRNSNQRYNLVSKATNDMVWDWEPLENKIYRNAEGWSKVFGVPPGEDINESDTWLKRIYADDYKLVYHKLKQILKDATVSHFEMEYRVNGENQDLIYVVDRGYVIRNNKGIAIRIIGSTKNITKEKKSNKEIERLSMIVKETINPTFLLDIDGKIEWVNKAFEKLSGYNAEESLGKYPFEILVGPETDIIAQRYIRIKRKAGKSFKCDIVGYNKLKEKNWVRVQGEPHFDPQGKLIHYFVSTTDISREKNAERDLLNNQNRFKALLLNSTDGLTIVNAEGEVLETSDAGFKILHYSKNQLSALNLDLIHEEDWPNVNQSFQAILNDSSSISVIETRILNGKGNYTWVESSFHNLLEEPGVKAIIIHFRDITERKLAEELIIKSEEKYRSLFMNHPSVMLICDPINFEILEANDAAISNYGYSQDELQQIPLSVLNKGAYKKEMKAIASSINDHTFKTARVWRQVAKSGKICMMEVVFHSVEYFGKRATMVIANNITEKMLLQLKLDQERKEKLNEITAAVITAQEKERRELGSELHDNINQILVTTRLYLEHARKNENVRMEMIEASKEFIMNAISEIRKLSKALIPPSLGDKGLRIALNELVESYKVINKYHLHLYFTGFFEDDISNDLKLTVFQIVQEQVNNVIKHADAKDIWINIVQSTSTLTLHVRDNGKGFNITERSRGVGLKNINSRSELHQGIMKIDTAPGKGCDLCVEFKIVCLSEKFQCTDKAA